MDKPTIYAVILAQLRARLAASPLAEQIAEWTDAQMLRRVFANYRGEHGLRLTQFGQQLMQYCFECYSFPQPKSLSISQILFLDSHAKMPYFCDREKLVVYDTKLAVYLRLVDGNLATLVEINMIEE